MQETKKYLSRIAARRRRRRMYGLCALASFFGCLVLVGGAWALFYSPLFHIQKIEIIGNDVVPSSEIESLVQSKIFGGGAWWKSVLGRDNILAWPDKLNGKEISSYPIIKQLNIEKQYLRRTILVQVLERKPLGVWCYRGAQADASSCWWFDDVGFIFKRSPATAGGLIVSVTDFSQDEQGISQKILPDRFVQNFISALDVIQKSGIEIEAITLHDIALEEIDAKTTKGPHVYFSLRFPADDLHGVLGDFYTKQSFKNLEYIDFRVEGRVYYK